MAIFRNVDSLTCALALTSVLLSAGCGGSKSGGATPGSDNNGATTGGSSSAGDSSSNNDGGDATSTMTPGGGAAGTEKPTGCDKSALTILFSPMYSAFDGVHTFQVPAVVNGLDPTQISITWTASDPSMVKLE